jgi:hypothetical protein
MEIIMDKHDRDEWGNIPLPGLSDEELFSKNWDHSARNYERYADPTYKKRHHEAIIKATQSEEWKKNQLEANQRMRTKEWNQKHLEIMKELYKDPNWIENVKKANSSPERNAKISKALSLIIQTPDGIFTSKEAKEYYGLTITGIRYRCNTLADWNVIKEGCVTEKTKQKISKASTLSAKKRLQTLAEKKGFICTPYGKFLSVREAWRIEKQKTPNIESNSHNWFLKQNLKDPLNYYKK